MSYYRANPTAFAAALTGPNDKPPEWEWQPDLLSDKGASLLRELSVAFPFWETGNYQPINTGLLPATTIGGMSSVLTSRGLAPYFDGANDFIDMPDYTIATNAPWSVACLVNVTSFGTSGFEGVASCLTAPSFAGWTLYVHKDASFGTYIGTHRRSTPGILTTGVWYVLAATWDGTLITLYLDGVQQRQDVDTGMVGSSDLRFGRYTQVGGVSGGNQYFNGTMSLGHVWNRGLSAGEISQVSNDMAMLVRPDLVRTMPAYFADGPPPPVTGPFGPLINRGGQLQSLTGGTLAA